MKLVKFLFTQVESADPQTQQKIELYLEVQLKIKGVDIDIHTFIKKEGWKKALFKAFRLLKGAEEKEKK